MVELSQFIPGTGRGTTEEWWRGSHARRTSVIGTAPPSLRATSPFREGF